MCLGIVAMTESRYDTATRRPEEVICTPSSVCSIVDLCEIGTVSVPQTCKFGRERIWW